MYSIYIAVTITGMKFFDIKTPFKGNGVYTLKIKDATMSKRYPSLPSWSKMLRLAHKSGK